MPATLTAAGGTAFAGFYSAGTALDPVTFAWPVEQAPVPPTPTIVVSKTGDISPAGEIVTDEDGSGATALVDFLASKKFI